MLQQDLSGDWTPPLALQAPSSPGTQKEWELSLAVTVLLSSHRNTRQNPAHSHLRKDWRNSRKLMPGYPRMKDKGLMRSFISFPEQTGKAIAQRKREWGRNRREERTKQSIWKPNGHNWTTNASGLKSGDKNKKIIGPTSSHSCRSKKQQLLR